MPVYSQTEQKLDISRNFRARDGTKWIYSSNLQYSLSAGLDGLISDDSLVSVSTLGTGEVYLLQGPPVRFKTPSNQSSGTKYWKINNCSQVLFKPLESSFVWSGWIYYPINIDPDWQPGQGKGESLVSTEDYEIYITSNMKLGLRLNSASSGRTNTISSVSWESINSLTKGKWHFVSVVLPGGGGQEGGGTITGPNQGDLTANLWYPIFYSSGRKLSITSKITSADDGAPNAANWKSSTTDLYIGYGFGDTAYTGNTSNFTYFSGQLTNISFFKPPSPPTDKNDSSQWITDEQMKALYLAHLRGTHIMGSGYLNKSPRIMLRDKDSRDSHPPSNHGGDERNTGNNAIIFDDSRVTDRQPSQISYPAVLSTSDFLLLPNGKEEATAWTNYETGSLVAPLGAAEASTAAYNSNYFEKETSGSIEPFNESRLYFDDSRSFYLTGTDKSIMPGFSQSLRRKSCFTIDMSPKEKTMFGMDAKSDGLGFLPYSVHSGDETNNGNPQVAVDQYTPLMVYWNKDKRKWEPTTRGWRHTGALHYWGTSSLGVPHVNINIATSAEHITTRWRDEAPIGFGHTMGADVLYQEGTIYKTSLSPQYEYTGTLDPAGGWKPMVDNCKMVAKPTSICGFPWHGRFAATSSQEVLMSDFITAPFLVEKVAYHFDATFDAPGNYLTFPRTTDGGFWLNGLGQMVNSAQLESYEDGGGEPYISRQAGVHASHFTFFILNQRKAQGEKSHLMKQYSYADNKAKTPRTSNFQPITSSIPGYFYTVPEERVQGEGFTSDGGAPEWIVPDKTAKTYVDTDRELVTYGQVLTIAEPRFGPNESDYNSAIPMSSASMDSMIAAMPHDLLIRHKNPEYSKVDNTYNPGDCAYSTTGSFVMEMDMKITAPYIEGLTMQNKAFKGAPNWTHPANRGATDQSTKDIDDIDSDGNTSETRPTLSNFKNRTVLEGDGTDYNGFAAIPNEWIGGRGFADGNRQGIFKGVSGRTVSGSIVTSIGGDKTPFLTSSGYSDSNPSSPYLVYPEDKLVFGWQAPFNPGQNEGYRGHRTSLSRQTMLPKPSKIIFYGSYLSNNLPIRSTYNQKLVGHSVHESIGSEHVHDQWDLASKEHFVGSTFAQIISGSSDASKAYYGRQIMEPHETALGTIAAAKTWSEDKYLARRVGGSTTLGTQGITGSLQRNARATDSSEIYLDSTMATVEDYWKVDGASYMDDYVSSFGVVDAFGIGSSKTGGTQVALGIINNHITWAFPFESRYSKLTRIRSGNILGGSGNAFFIIEDEFAWNDLDASSSTAGVSDDAVPTPPIDTALYPSSLASQRDSASNGNIGSSNIFLDENHYNELVSAIFGGSTKSIFDAVKRQTPWRGMVFGIGDGSRSRHTAQGHTHPTGAESAYRIASTSPISGYKYGLININPASPTMVYRRDRWGQLADLMEGRKFTAHYKGEDIIFPVTVRFSNRSGLPTSPGNTTCSNISLNCTSSLPYFDRDNNQPPKNRDSLQPGIIDIERNFRTGRGPFAR